MSYNLLFCSKWPYIITVVVALLVVFSEIINLILNFRGITVIPWGMLTITISFTTVSFLFLCFSVSALKKLCSIEKEGRYSYIIELPESFFLKEVFVKENRLSGRDRVLVSSFKIYSDGTVCFGYTIPAEKIGTKYQYNDPAEKAAKNEIYKGYYNRIYSIKEGRYLLSGDLEKYVVKELYSEEQDK